MCIKLIKKKFAGPITFRNIKSFNNLGTIQVFSLSLSFCLSLSVSLSLSLTYSHRDFSLTVTWKNTISSFVQLRVMQQQIINKASSHHFGCSVPSNKTFKHTHAHTLPVLYRNGRQVFYFQGLFIKCTKDFPP